MDFNVTDFNERVKTINILDLLIGLIISLVLALIAEGIFKDIAVNFESSTFLLFFLSLFFVYCFKGTVGLSSNLSSAFENHLKEILYLFIINLIFGMFALSLFCFFDSSFFGDLNFSSLSGWALVVDIIITSICVPISEELIFRGVIFNTLNNRMNFVYAMIISSVLFALFHGFGRIITTFLFGLCLCILYLKTDNILIPIIIHAINNFVACLLTDIAHIENIVLVSPTVLITLIISLIGGILVLRYIFTNIKILKSTNS